jgi:hypothetical protein
MREQLCCKSAQITSLGRAVTDLSRLESIDQHVEHHVVTYDTVNPESTRNENDFDCTLVEDDYPMSLVPADTCEWDQPRNTTHQLLPLESFNIAYVPPIPSIPATGVDHTINIDNKWGPGVLSVVEGKYDLDLLHDCQNSYNNATCNNLNGFISNSTDNTILHEGLTDYSFNPKSTSQVGHFYSVDHQLLEECSITSTTGIDEYASHPVTSIDDVGFDAIPSNSLIWSLRRRSESSAPERKLHDLAVRPPQGKSNDRSLAPATPFPHSYEFPQPRRYTFAADAVTLYGRRSPDLTFIHEPLSNSRTDKCRDVKGRRTNPLPPEIRQRAKKSRQLKLVCIRCKKDRQAVSLKTTQFH